MSLKRRLVLNGLLMILGVLALVAVALWSLVGLNADLTRARAQFDELKSNYRTGVAIVRAREALRSPSPQIAQARSHLATAQLRAREADAGTVKNRPLDEVSEIAPRNTLMAELNKAQTALGRIPADSEGRVSRKAIDALNRALGAIAGSGQRSRVRIEQMQEQAVGRFERAAMGLIALTGGMLVLTAGFTFMQYRAVMGPLRRLRRAVHRFASGDFAYRLDVAGDRELAQLGRELNWMASELRTLYDQLEARVREQSAQLARSERLASVGFLAAGVSHELNNPLSIITHQAELAQRQAGGSPNDADMHAWQLVREEAFRCKRITDRLLGVAGRDALQTEAIDANQLISQAIEVARRIRPGATQRLEAAPAVDQRAMVAADAIQLRQVMVNLVVNAIDATDGESGRITIQAALQPDHVALAVIDNGQGMDRWTLERVFEPLYTTKAGRQQPGTGLGLSLCHTIVHRLGGSLYADSEGPGQGAVFTIQMPRTSSSASGESEGKPYTAERQWLPAIANNTPIEERTDVRESACDRNRAAGR